MAVNIYFKQNSHASSSPYYLFYFDSSYTTSVTSLEKGKTYIFNYDSNDIGHSFYIGATNTWRSDAGSLTITPSNVTRTKDDGIQPGESLTVEIPTNYNLSEIYYYCTVHSSMINSISLTNASGGSNGDPYVFPILSKTPVKLPNKNACYRLYEKDNVFINAEVSQASPNHIVRMIKYAKNITPKIHNITFDGYYYSKFFINSENNHIMIDLVNKEYVVSKQHTKYFTVSTSTRYYTKGIFNEPSKALDISWSTKDGITSTFSALFFDNPHQENGLLFETDDLTDSIGMIVRNYKPKLMELPTISTTKYNKLHRRLKKSKHKYHYQNIMGKNELWHFK